MTEENLSEIIGDNAIVFENIPANLFPFTVEFYDNRNGVVFHTVAVPEPGVLIVPPGVKYGVPPGCVEVRMTYGNGQVEDTGVEDA